MQKQNDTELNIRKYIQSEPLFHKFKSDLATLIFEESYLDRGYFLEKISIIIAGWEDEVDIEGLTDEIFKFYLRSCEFSRKIREMDFVIPSAEKGIKTLYDDYYKENFGKEN